MHLVSWRRMIVKDLTWMNLQRYGSPMRKLEIMKAVAPYRPLARSLINVARSSRNAGTYATAIKDMNAEPKNC